MFCRKCGTKINDDATFCYKCGEKSVGANDLKKNLSEKETETEVGPEKKSVNKFLIGAIACVVVLIGILAIYLTASKPVIRKEVYSGINSSWGASVEAVKKEIPLKETSKSNRKFKELRSFEADLKNKVICGVPITNCQIYFFNDKMYQISFDLDKQDIMPPKQDKEESFEEWQLSRKFWVEEVKKYQKRLKSEEKTLINSLTKVYGQPILKEIDKKSIMGTDTNYEWDADDTKIRFNSWHLAMLDRMRFSMQSKSIKAEYDQLRKKK